MLRKPDFVIGGAENPYMLRWWVIPRNRWFNIYLHKILRDDDPRALHDHPWWNISVVLKGGYLEWFSTPGATPIDCRWRGPLSIVFRKPTAAHRLTLGSNGPAWSLFITGPKVRNWGFHCEKGWRPWEEFCATDDTGRIGRGCE